MAVARGHHERAVSLARDAIEQSRSKHRAKYEVQARAALAGALAALGRKAEALAELSVATAAAERLGNPTLQVSVAAAVMATEPDEDVAVKARDGVDSVPILGPSGYARRPSLSSDVRLRTGRSSE